MDQQRLDLAPDDPDDHRLERLIGDLNAPQRGAVMANDGPVLILAGAGSGKTRALTRKIAALVDHAGFAPWEILAVTFTNKAAAELRQRCADLLGDRAEGLWLGTFHSIGVRVLRRHGELLGIRRGFVIYDQADQLTMVKRCLELLDLDPKRFDAKDFQAHINRHKRECRGPDHPDTPRVGPLNARRHRVYQRYEAEMRAAGAVDFGDLIYLPYRLVSELPAVALEYQRLWRYILVDEFQDTNRAQYELLRAVLNPARRICVVGDDDQSIYRWRGADVENILGFDRDFPGTQVFRLEQNYRSTKRILAVSGALIARNHARHGKTLWTERERGDKVRVYQAQSERAEAQYVARRIEALRGRYRLSEMAIFYRTNAQSRAFEDALRDHGIPYKVIGGLRFYDRAEVKDVVAYLRLLVNPSDPVALQRVINRPARGIGKTTVARCLHRATVDGTTLWEAVCALARDGKGAIRNKLKPFVELMVALKATADSASALATISAVVDDTGYLRKLDQDGSVEAETRADNVRELVGAVDEFTQRAADSGLAAFLDEVSLLSDLDAADLDQEDAVAMMTGHTAKGLEFDVVFVTGLEERLFPHANSLDSEGGVEEERRLAYVAMTRARHVLHLTHAASRRRFGGPPQQTDVSRFLVGLPAEHLHQEGDQGRHGRYVDRQHDRSPWGRDGGRAGFGAGAGAGRARSRHAAAAAEPDYAVDAEPDYLGESQDPDDQPRPGSHVFHTMFGRGRILTIEGQGKRAKAKIEFADGRVRKIMLAVLTLL